VNEINQEDTHRTIERAAREPYGRLVAYLSRRQVLHYLRASGPEASVFPFFPLM
jgi:hypothetical protein